MKKYNRRFSLVAFPILLLFSCQPVSPIPSLSPDGIRTTATSRPTIGSTATPQTATELPTETATLIPISEKSLAGLIISSPILGSPYEVPGVSPPTTITPNGLGIINSDGKLIRFSDIGLFQGISPSGMRIVSQRGFEDEYTDHIDNLYVYDAKTGETKEIVDDLEHEGGKTILAWSPDEQTFIYTNDYLTVLFEAFGYFGAKQLLSADVATGTTKLLIPEGYQFDVSPDQTQIAYTTGKLLDTKTDEAQLESFGCFQPYIYNIITTTSQAFDVSQLSESPVCLGYPQWSPDGKKIAWIGYFANETFRPIIFDSQGNVGRIYDPLDEAPRATHRPTDWYLGEAFWGGRLDPDWVNNSTFWTPSYEVDVETGETSAPREIDLPYNPRIDKYLSSSDGSLRVSIDEERDAILVQDGNGNPLATFFLDDLYEGPRQEILTSPFFLPGRANVVGWSPFAPPVNVETQ